jgi:hypothetical protein
VSMVRQGVPESREDLLSETSHWTGPKHCAAGVTVFPHINDHRRLLIGLTYCRRSLCLVTVPDVWSGWLAATWSLVIFSAGMISSFGG